MSPFRASHTAGKPERSFTQAPFPPWDKSQAEEDLSWPQVVKLCYPGEGLMKPKSKLLFPSPMSPNLFGFFCFGLVFSFNGVLKLLLWKRRLPQRLSICE